MDLRVGATEVRQWAQLCVDALARHRAEIDALNVFPVPDKDTGTNSYLTFAAGVEALDHTASDAEVTEVASAFGDGLLTGAKGNSGVILSQLVRATLRALPLADQVTGEQLATALTKACLAAREAVGTPVEGTILSVAEAAAEAARSCADAGATPPQIISAAAAAARTALARTPEQLERLAQAGVVDAGGRALVVLLETTDQSLSGTVPAPTVTKIPVPIVADNDLVEGGPSYEVMYLLSADDTEIPALRSALSSLGDSLVVVGSDRLWNVHVHVDDVGAAIEAGMAAGRPYRIAVTHFADQLQHSKQAAGDRRVVIAATTGDGLAALCREAGAEPLPFTRETPLTQAVMTAAMQQPGVSEVIVLPNNVRYVSQFEAAAQSIRSGGVRVAVIPTHAQVQGLAALAVHDETAAFDDVVVAMSSAAGATRHGAVTVAAEPAMTMVGPCAAGDYLGVASGDFAVIGTDVLDVTERVVAMLMTQSAEMVTVVLGESNDERIGQHVEQFLRTSRPDVDLMVYFGGQENYHAFLAVE